MKYILYAFILLTFNIAHSKQALLTEDPDTVSRALWQLDRTLSYENAQDIGRIFKGLSSESPNANFKPAHIIWRFMAALYASGYEQAVNLYHALLDSGHKKDSSLLSRIGYQWGSQPMNPTEKHILMATQRFIESSHNPETRDDHRHGYITSLLHARPATEEDYKQLPMVFWPNTMVDAGISAYISNSPLNTVLPESTFRKGLHVLVHHWDKEWESAANVCEQVFNYIKTEEEHCGPLQYIWERVTQSTISAINVETFKVWFKTQSATSHHQPDSKPSYYYGMYNNFGGSPEGIEHGLQWFTPWLKTQDSYLPHNFSCIYRKLKGSQEEWGKFLTWARPQLEGIEESEQGEILTSLFFMYWEAAGDNAAIKAFKERVKPWLDDSKPKKDVLRGLTRLHTLSRDSQMTDEGFISFLTWAHQPWVKELDHPSNTIRLWNALELYQDSDNPSQEAIEAFYKTIPHAKNPEKPKFPWDRDSKSRQVIFWKKSVFNIVGGEERYQRYIKFFGPIMEHISESWYLYIKSLADMHQHFNGSESDIINFLQWSSTFFDLTEPALNVPEGLAEYWKPFLRTPPYASAGIKRLDLAVLEELIPLYEAEKNGFLTEEQKVKKEKLRTSHRGA